MNFKEKTLVLNPNAPHSISQSASYVTSLKERGRSAGKIELATAPITKGDGQLPSERTTTIRKHIETRVSEQYSGK
jgi:hypothetical protein